MKNIYSNIIRFNNFSLKKILENLKSNKILGLPTETVYGLGGNAYSKNAINKIYKLKKRPKSNPLIIHYYDYKSAERDVYTSEEFFKLYRKVCPGPLTFIMKRKLNSKVCSLATSKLKTIAIRFPKNKIIRKILKKLSFPLAMPSANLSRGISPVSALDVFDEFGKKVDLIVDGGKTKIGVESTVIDLTNKIKILRPGFVDRNFISKTLNKRVTNIRKIKYLKSPGMMKTHYSPGIPVKLNQKNISRGCALITFGKSVKNKKHTFNLSRNSNLNEAAKNLYKILRIIKKKGYKKIHVVKIPNFGLGVAINDRLKHAANLK